MSTHDVADIVRRSTQERAAVPAMIDALQLVLYHADGPPAVLSAAERALAAAGRPWDRQRYILQRNLRNAYPSA